MTLKTDQKAATVQDVARHANVSTATVSRTLSAPDSVSAKKRQAVLDAIEATGYRVNRAARSLRTQRSNNILVLLPNLGNPFFSLVLQGIVDVLTPAGQSLVVAETRQIYSAGDDLFSYYRAQRADGMIVLDGGVPAESLNRFLASEPDANIVFACEWTNVDGFPSVRSSNEDGAILAIQHLYDAGHRNIIQITGPKDNVLTHARIAGHETACKKLGLEPHYIEGDFSLDAGLQAAKQIKAMTDKPTAIFCASDVIAFGLISGLARCGIRVPEDISVIGFDDLEFSEHFVPPLTTIRQDRVALGATAAQVLLRGGPSKADLVEMIPVSLIERSSTQRAKTKIPV